MIPRGELDAESDLYCTSVFSALYLSLGHESNQHLSHLHMRECDEDRIRKYLSPSARPKSAHEHIVYAVCT